MVESTVIPDQEMKVTLACGTICGRVVQLDQQLSPTPVDIVINSLVSFAPAVQHLYAQKRLGQIGPAQMWAFQYHNEQLHTSGSTSLQPVFPPGTGQPL